MLIMTMIRTTKLVIKTLMFIVRVMAIPTMLAPPGRRDMTLPSKAAVSAGSPLAVKLLQVEIVMEGEIKGEEKKNEAA